MIWLTWRQFRAAAGMMAAALIVLAGILTVTGQGLAGDYSTGIAACVTQSDGCSNFFQQFYHDNLMPFLAVTAVVLVLPALSGLFWGAPLVARELESGTHRLVWNQSITRTRWLAVKLGLTGLAAMTAAGLGSLAVTWWSVPVDKAAAGNAPSIPRLGPLLFPSRGIVPIGYAAFAVALGVAVGMLVRRSLPAMAITLLVFVVVQVVMPLGVRPHYLSPKRAAIELSTTTLEDFGIQQGGGPLHLTMKSQVPTDTGAWILSSRLVDASGRTVRGESIPVSTSSGPCAPHRQMQAGQAVSGCLAEINRLGYRQELVYQPSSRFWTFQWIETAIYSAFALGLAGFGFWHLRRRLS
ncbi:ABC transporter permease [Actinoallomurus sp. NBC_01490]|uniref:ABC transporter permease n=1 Tax=Actinoallomurus sp. NBC_01490 TaxID=2903557 RepID=UPI002E2F6834|nr:ABC transporter permease [Actinoallomurus sp. NBC_01490]